MSYWHPSGDICQVKGTVLWSLVFVGKVSERVHGLKTLRKLEGGCGWEVVEVTEKSRKQNQK